MWCLGFCLLQPHCVWGSRKRFIWSQICHFWDPICGITTRPNPLTLIRSCRPIVARNFQEVIIFHNVSIVLQFIQLSDLHKHTHTLHGRKHGDGLHMRKWRLLCLPSFVAHSWLLTHDRDTGGVRQSASLRCGGTKTKQESYREWATKSMEKKRRMFPTCPLLILCHLWIIQHQSWTLGDLRPGRYRS